MRPAWRVVQLGEVLTQYREYVRFLEEREYPKLSVKLYGRGCVVDGSARGDEVRMQRHQLAKSGQVILSEIWGKKGAIGYVPPAGEGALVTSHFFLFDLDETNLSRNWFHWLIRANYFEPELSGQARGTTGYAAVRAKQFLDLKFPLPPLAEQQRIVARIEALAGRIDEGTSIQQVAIQESELLFDSALRQVFCDWLGESKRSTLGEVCEAILDNLHSTPNYSEEGFPCVRSSDVGRGKLCLDSAKRTSEIEYLHRTSRGAPQRDDIVYVREGGGLGKTALVQTDEKFSLGQRVMLFRLDENKVNPRFCLYQLLSPYIYDEQVVPFTKGVTSPHINIGAIRQIRFLLPNRSEQDRVVRYLDALMSRKEDLRRLQETTQAELAALLPAVLDKAFRGEL